MGEEILTLHIIADNTELEDGTLQAEKLLHGVDLKGKEQEYKLKQIAMEAARMERAVAKQYQSLMGVVASGFSVYRNLLTVMGVTMDSVEAATLRALEVVITSVVSMHEALRLSGKDALGPFGLALEGIRMASSIASALLLVQAQRQARQEFMQIRQQIEAAQSTLDIVSRVW